MSIIQKAGGVAQSRNAEGSAVLPGVKKENKVSHSVPRSFSEGEITKRRRRS